MKSWVIPSRKILVDDFVKYFQNRFIELKSIIQERNDIENLTTINKVSSQKQNISIIGMVSKKRITKNKNVILELEDLTGRISVLVSCTKEDLLNKVKAMINGMNHKFPQVKKEFEHFFCNENVYGKLNLITVQGFILLD